MSKLIERLNAVSSGGLAPMGFRAGGAKPSPRMVLVAHIAAGAKTSGADAVLLSIPKTGAKSPKTLVKSAIPWGGWLKEVSGPVVKQLKEDGADFVVFPVGSASSALVEEEKLGKIVEIEPDLEASLLKAIDDLPVDAVLISGEKAALTWQELMLIRRSVNLLSKPVLVAVSPDITSSELQALGEVGVGGVVAGDKIDRLRQMIDKLPSPKAAKRHVRPLVPRIGGVRTVSEREEEEEEEED